jgi:uncharacterized protein YgiM (DUF1202 family)
MKKSALGIFFVLALLAACSEDSSNKSKALTKDSPGIVRQAIPRDSGVKPPAKAHARKQSRLVFARTSCNIRGGPGTKYPIIRRAAKGEKLEYISLVSNWYKLKVKKGRPQEWVHKSVVISSKESTP